MTLSHPDHDTVPGVTVQPVVGGSVGGGGGGQSGTFWEKFGELNPAIKPTAPSPFGTGTPLRALTGAGEVAVGNEGACTTWFAPLISDRGHANRSPGGTVPGFVKTDESGADRAGGGAAQASAITDIATASAFLSICMIIVLRKL